jgi:hypothetical protein
MYPPQQYAPPGPQQYAPPPPQQQYQQQAPAMTMPNIVDPTGGGGDWAPMPRHLAGRAVLILPRMLDQSNQYQGTPRPSVTVDFVVVNIDPQGNPLPPIEYGDNQSRTPGEARPNCWRLDAPSAEFTGARWNSEVIVKELAAHVGSGNLVMGRIVQGTQGNKPMLLNPLEQNDAARGALAAAWQQKTAQPGSLRREATPINGGPPQKTQAGQQQAPAQQYAPQQQYGGPPPQQAYGPPPGTQVQYGPPQPQQYAQQPQQAAGPALPPHLRAAGWTDQQWMQLPEAARAQMAGQQ